MLNVRYDKLSEKFVLKTEIETSGAARNPFDVFGFGIKAYFQFLKLLMFALFGLTLLYVPVISMYINGENYRKETGTGVGLSNYWQISATLGNLG